MPVDPQVQPLLEEMAAVPRWHMLPVAEARALAIAQNMEAALGPELVAHVEDRTIPGPEGPLPVRIYRPDGPGPYPILVYFHGSGFVICNLDTHDSICRSLTNGVACVTVSVDYRLAPDHPFPAAPDDCYAATVWAATHGAEIGGDPARLAVGGDSAGGCLAAVVAMQVRDQGGPRLAYQLLIYPVTDLPSDLPSYVENAEGYGLTRADMIWFWGHYLPDRSLGDDPRAAPLRARDLSNLPPALIVTAEYDVLRDEAELFARRLREAGTPVELIRYDGQIHGFFGQAQQVDRARQAIADACMHLRAAFGTA